MKVKPVSLATVVLCATLLLAWFINTWNVKTTTRFLNIVMPMLHSCLPHLLTCCRCCASSNAIICITTRRFVFTHSMSGCNAFTPGLLNRILDKCRQGLNIDALHDVNPAGEELSTLFLSAGISAIYLICFNVVIRFNRCHMQM